MKPHHDHEERLAWKRYSAQCYLYMQEAVGSCNIFVAKYFANTFPGTQASFSLSTWGRVLTVYLIVDKLIKKFPPFFNVHHRLHNPRYLSQLNTVHISTFYFIIILFNIIPTRTSRYSKRFLHVWFSDKYFVRASHLPHTWNMSNKSSMSRSGHPSLIWPLRKKPRSWHGIWMMTFTARGKTSWEGRMASG
jgi:hypothetical protein